MVTGIWHTVKCSLVILYSCDVTLPGKVMVWLDKSHRSGGWRFAQRKGDYGY